MATKPISPDKDVRDLIRRAEDLGYSAERTSGGHIKLTHPQVEHPIFCSSTPSDYRALKNCEALVYRSVASAANERLRSDISRSDAVTAQLGPMDCVNECPACRGRGVVKSFTHPQGLVAHMANEHPVTTEEVDEWNQGFESQQEEEDVPTESEQTQEKGVSVPELEELLEEWIESDQLEMGGVVTLADLKGYFGTSRNVGNAVLSLKRRGAGKGLRLKQYGSPRSGQYEILDDPELLVEWDTPDEETPPTPKFEEARIYEELNRFMDGRVLLRDADGNLYQAAIEPLT